MPSPSPDAIAHAVGTLVGSPVLAVDAAVRATAAERLAPFVRRTAEWNERTNLTGARTAEAYAEILCADALVAADPALVPLGAAVVDVGSGGGAPALPLVLLRPDLRAVLVEPLRKRVAFLRSAVGALGLADRVRVVEGRVRPEAPAVAGGPFDLAISRATFAPPVWARLAPALAPACLVFLGAEPFEPPPDARVVARRAYRLPSADTPRAILRLVPA